MEQSNELFLTVKAKRKIKLQFFICLLFFSRTGFGWKNPVWDLGKSSRSGLLTQDVKRIVYFAPVPEGRGYYRREPAEAEAASWSDIEDERERSRPLLSPPAEVAVHEPPPPNSGVVGPSQAFLLEFFSSILHLLPLFYPILTCVDPDQ